MSRTDRLALMMGVGLCSLWSGGVAQGSLSWEKEFVLVSSAPGEGTATGRFNFSNTGNYPVKIEGFKTNCGCTAATSEKRVIAPGEKGEVTVTYNTTGRHGLHEAPITVKTDDPKAPESVIRLRVSIQAVLDVQPTFVFWDAKEALAPKKMTVKVGDGFPVKALTASSSEAAVKVRVETVKAGSEYSVWVTPPAEAKGLRATIEMLPDYPVAKPKAMVAHVRVR
jgi:Protein of unknown function (DUF1573)